MPVSAGRRRVVLGAAIGVAAVGGTALAFQKLVRPAVAAKAHPIPSDGVNAPRGMAWIPGGPFLMGADNKQAQRNERPVHKVRVSGFWMDVTHVTNDQFAAFVTATRYVTTAEKTPDWETVRAQLPPGTPKPDAAVLVAGAMVFTGTVVPVRFDDFSQWWAYVPGADWRHPQGPKSSIVGKGDHPVVQVSYEDVATYARWIGKRLPTEAEWEFAARGGLDQKTYAWGNDGQSDGAPQANTWNTHERPFPVVMPGIGTPPGTSPVGSFARNAYGLSDITGNAWQWVADWYRYDYFEMQSRQSGGRVIVDPQGPRDSFDPTDYGVPRGAPKRVIRGGSFLCNEDYCESYRPSARRGLDPFNPMSHVGFRLAKDVDPLALVAH